VDARLIHTGPHSMHIAIHVRSSSPRTPSVLTLTTRCMSVFVDVGSDRRALPVPPLPLSSEEDHRLASHARELIRMRSELEPLPLEHAPAGDL
jgi:acyl-CoA hydrolase